MSTIQFCGLLWASWNFLTSKSGLVKRKISKMKIICIGDIHGKDCWKKIVSENDFDLVVFLADYFDAYDTYFPETQMLNFREIARFKEENKDRVVLLIGNHDEHYFPFMGDSGTAGYQTGHAFTIGHLLSTYKDILQMAYGIDNYLFTHAGVCETWLKETAKRCKIDMPEPYTASNIADWVNDVWRYKPLLFKFNGEEQYGDNVGQTPIWIRPRSLMRGAKNIKKAGIVQIVGHTSQKKVDIKGKSTGSKYYFIDTLETSGEYLIVMDGQTFTQKVEKVKRTRKSASGR